MENKQTISRDFSMDPGLNPALLKEQAIEVVQRLAGQTWTDHNPHDPGINMLESLSYVITDLCYRLSFPLPDLLTPENAVEEIKHFLSREEMLYTSPVSVNDYRQLLLDIDGIKNVWVVPAADDIDIIGIKDHKVSFETETRGVWNVLVELSNNITDDGKDIITGEDRLQEIAKAVRARFLAERNVGEDINTVRFLDREKISMSMTLDLHAGTDFEAALIKIFRKIQDVISPGIKNYNLLKALEEGKLPEELFSGPDPLGARIDKESLTEIKPAVKIYASDIMASVTSNEEVDLMREFRLLEVGEDTTSSADSHSDGWKNSKDRWFSPIENGKVCYFDVEKALKGNSLKIYIDGHPVVLDNAARGRILTAVLTYNIDKGMKDPWVDEELLQGRYRNLRRYKTLQKEFPSIYKISGAGIAPGEDEETVAMIRQLQGFLLLFDQILANEFEQLEVIRKLLSMPDVQKECNPFCTLNTVFEKIFSSRSLSTDDVKSFWESIRAIPATHTSQPIAGIHQIKELLGDFYEDYTEGFKVSEDGKVVRPVLPVLNDFTSMTEEPFSVDKLNRLHRLYSHFLARFHESLPAPEQLKYQGVLANYTDVLKKHPRAIESRSQEVFIKKLAILKQITDQVQLLNRYSSMSKRRAGAYDYLGDQSFGSANVAPLVSRISARLGMPPFKRGPLALKNQEGFHMVEGVLLRDHGIRDIEILLNTGDEKASLVNITNMLYFIFPRWTTRFQNEDFRSMITDVVIQETPVNLVPRILFLDRAEMNLFDRVYNSWTNAMTQKPLIMTEEDKCLCTDEIPCARCSAISFIERMSDILMCFLVNENSVEAGSTAIVDALYEKVRQEVSLEELEEFHIEMKNKTEESSEDPSSLYDLFYEGETLEEMNTYLTGLKVSEDGNETNYQNDVEALTAAKTNELRIERVRDYFLSLVNQYGLTKKTETVEEKGQFTKTWVYDNKQTGAKSSYDAILKKVEQSEYAGDEVFKKFLRDMFFVSFGLIEVMPPRRRALYYNETEFLNHLNKLIDISDLSLERKKEEKNSLKLMTDIHWGDYSFKTGQQLFNIFFYGVESASMGLPPQSGGDLFIPKTETGAQSAGSVEMALTESGGYFPRYGELSDLPPEDREVIRSSFEAVIDSVTALSDEEKTKYKVLATVMLENATYSRENVLHLKTLSDFLVDNFTFSSSRGGTDSLKKYLSSIEWVCSDFTCDHNKTKLALLIHNCGFRDTQWKNRSVEIFENFVRDVIEEKITELGNVSGNSSLESVLGDIISFTTWMMAEGAPKKTEVVAAASQKTNSLQSASSSDEYEKGYKDFENVILTLLELLNKKKELDLDFFYDFLHTGLFNLDQDAVYERFCAFINETLVPVAENLSDGFFLVNEDKKLVNPDGSLFDYEGYYTEEEKKKANADSEDKADGISELDHIKLEQITLDKNGVVIAVGALESDYEIEAEMIVNKDGSVMKKDGVIIARDGTKIYPPKTYRGPDGTGEYNTALMFESDGVFYPDGLTHIEADKEDSNKPIVKETSEGILAVYHKTVIIKKNDLFLSDNVGAYPVLSKKMEEIFHKDAETFDMESLKTELLKEEYDDRFFLVQNNKLKDTHGEEFVGSVNDEGIFQFKTKKVILTPEVVGAETVEAENLPEGGVSVQSDTEDTVTETTYKIGVIEVNNTGTILTILGTSSQLTDNSVISPDGTILKANGDIRTKEGAVIKPDRTIEYGELKFHQLTDTPSKHKVTDGISIEVERRVILPSTAVSISDNESEVKAVEHIKEVVNEVFNDDAQDRSTEELLDLLSNIISRSASEKLDPDKIGFDVLDTLTKEDYQRELIDLVPSDSKIPVSERVRGYIIIHLDRMKQLTELKRVSIRNFFIYFLKETGLCSLYILDEQEEQLKSILNVEKLEKFSQYDYADAQSDEEKENNLNGEIIVLKNLFKESYDSSKAGKGKTLVERTEYIYSLIEKVLTMSEYDEGEIEREKKILSFLKVKEPYGVSTEKMSGYLEKFFTNTDSVKQLEDYNYELERIRNMSGSQGTVQDQDSDLTLINEKIAFCQKWLKNVIKPYPVLDIECLDREDAEAAVDADTRIGSTFRVGFNEVEFIRPKGGVNKSQITPATDKSDKSTYGKLFVVGIDESKKMNYLEEESTVLSDAPKQVLDES